MARTSFLSLYDQQRNALERQYDDARRQAAAQALMYGRSLMGGLAGVGYYEPPTKTLTLREELQKEIDEWLK